jgi:hypothetical protein
MWHVWGVRRSGWSLVVGKTEGNKPLVNRDVDGRIMFIKWIFNK